MNFYKAFLAGLIPSNNPKYIISFFRFLRRKMLNLEVRAMVMKVMMVGNVMEKRENCGKRKAMSWEKRERYGKRKEIW